MKDSELAEITNGLPGGVLAALRPGSKVVVTGCAGFIGSTLAEALLGLGCRVVGIDCLTDYYDPSRSG